ncbi:MAG: hypothetical protein COV59_00710 [Candidatus Magasanikbacteria bacterium CG11_big_fil_rev_8_21_14_0_20_39_34]|uniref:Vitamin K epoxide reductase domain-containing protein n=1 Tax=Candidatus Magasanikbacteria bacterium CG11_big_fil_rev_8_21_14_0_20_39_34 TaxID=1974653 RepID=A0A2H0N6G1_9BACT|nr:MAG: hypothetical protein COV59_00710 [Candidatus Magasanikbacteria bacterium CG11_big_fil_rev_8_21_14_0_20_39_34]
MEYKYKHLHNMMNLKKLFHKHSSKVPSFIPWVFLVLGLIGFADATYLTFKHLNGALGCSFSTGCETVLSSKYATIFGIPVALPGVLYYLSLIFLSLLYFDKKNPLCITLLSHLTWIGLLASIWFEYLQIFVIRANCPFCLISASTSLILFIFGRYTVSYCKKRGLCDYR